MQAWPSPKAFPVVTIGTVIYDVLPSNVIYTPVIHRYMVVDAIWHIAGGLWSAWVLFGFQDYDFG